MAYFHLGVRLLLIGVLLWAAVAKVRRRSFTDFASSVVTLGLTRTLPAARRVAVLVVTAEFAVVGMLAVPVTARVGLAAAAGMLMVFTVVIARAVRSGVGASCQCFGSGSKPPTVTHAVCNGVLTIVAGAGAVASSDGAPHPVGASLVVALAALGTVLVVFVDDLVDLMRLPGAPGPGA